MLVGKNRLTAGGRIGMGESRDREEGGIWPDVRVQMSPGSRHGH